MKLTLDNIRFNYKCICGIGSMIILDCWKHSTIICPSCEREWYISRPEIRYGKINKKKIIIETTITQKGEKNDKV